MQISRHHLSLFDFKGRDLCVLISMFSLCTYRQVGPTKAKRFAGAVRVYRILFRELVQVLDFTLVNTSSSKDHEYELHMV